MIFRDDLDGLHHIHKALHEAQRRYHGSRDDSVGGHLESSRRQQSLDNNGGHLDSSRRRQQSHDNAAADVIAVDNAVTSNTNNNADIGGNESQQQQVVDIKLDGFNAVCHLSHGRDVTQLVPLQQQQQQQLQLVTEPDAMTYCMVYAVDVTHGRKVMTLRSPLRVSEKKCI